MALSTYCKVVGGVIVKRARKDDPETAVVNGEPVWRALVEAGAQPAYDSITHHAPILVETIEPTQVVQSWQAAVAKTQAEIDTEQASRRSAVMARLERLDSFERLMLRIQFNHENRIRAIEGSPQISVAQFLTWIDNNAWG